MAKFVIECSSCGKYAEARTGFFAKKKIECSCGHIIDVKTEKMINRTCPHCGNNVVFDQSKGAKAKCPVCGEPINTLAEQDKTVEFSCSQCGVRLRTTKGVNTYTCPVCDHVNDVAERLKTEEIRHDGLASVIKYEGDNKTLVWKHPIEDFNLGSQLIVHESQEAIFFRDGQALDLFGAGRYTLETQQLPILEKLYKLPTDTEGTFHSEVYFINLTTQMGIKWGTDSKIRLFDPMTGMHIELGASGEFNIHVINSRKLLLKLVGTTGELNQEQILSNNGKGFFRSMVMAQVKNYLASSIKENGFNILEIDQHLMELSEVLKNKINPFINDYGLEITEFFINNIVTPDDDPDFIRLKKQFAEQYLGVKQEQIRKNIALAEAERKAVEAQTMAQMKIIGAQGTAEALRIQKQAEADAYKMQAFAEAEEMKMKGYTYQQETARQVGLGATSAMAQGGSGGGIGEIAGLGMTLGAMGGILNMTRDAMSSTLNTGMDIGHSLNPSKPESVSSYWICPKCGAKNSESKFCPECGEKKLDEPKVWDCPNCGKKNITSKFCPECGTRKPEQNDLWDCPKCGAKEIKGKFCPECGSKREK